METIDDGIKDDRLIRDRLSCQQSEGKRSSLKTFVLMYVVHLNKLKSIRQGQ